MNFIIVGCGRMGAELAHRLFEQSHNVALVDQNPEAFDNLPPHFMGRVIEGDGLSQDILRRAGIHQADGLAAVTNSDTLNTVVAHVARTVYHVPRVVVRNYDSRWLALHEAFNLPVVSSTIWGTQRIMSLLDESDLSQLFSLDHGQINLCEFIVPSRYQGHQLLDLFPERDCLVIAVTRAGQELPPAQVSTLEAGDVIYVNVPLAKLVALRHRLDGTKKVEA